MPEYQEGWQDSLDVLQEGKFFSTTGEVLITSFEAKKNIASFNIRWTFPMNYAEIISGDGVKAYRNKINLDNTLPFGEKTIRLPLDLKDRKWVRVEAWDIAANGAFTQMIWLKCFISERHSLKISYKEEKPNEFNSILKAFLQALRINDVLS
jgi:hypothetical protein